MKNMEAPKNITGGRAWWGTLVTPVLWEADTGGSGLAASLRSRMRGHAHAHALCVCVCVSLSLSQLSEFLRNVVRPGLKIKYERIGPGA